MDSNLIISFKGAAPTIDALQVLIEDYLGEALTATLRGQASLTVRLRGDASAPFKRLGGSTLPRGPRELVVYISPTSINVHTKGQDDYTNTLAFGLAILLALFWEGEFNASEGIPFNKPMGKRRTRVGGNEYVCHIPQSWKPRGPKALCGRLLCDVNSWASKKDFESFDADLEANCRACLKVYRASKAR